MADFSAQPGDGAAAVDWAFELQRHQRWLRTVLFARTGDRAAVEDLWQQVALATFRQSSQSNEVRRPAPWLYRIALRQVLQHRRRCGRVRRRETQYAEERSFREPVEPDPLDWLLAEEERSLVRAAVAELDPRDAEILMLKYSEDWSYRQIGEHLGLSESAIESRLFRARTRLRHALASLMEPDAVRRDEVSVP